MYNSDYPSCFPVIVEDEIPEGSVSAAYVTKIDIFKTTLVDVSEIDIPHLRKSVDVGIYYRFKFLIRA